MRIEDIPEPQQKRDNSRPLELDHPLGYVAVHHGHVAFGKNLAKHIGCSSGFWLVPATDLTSKQRRFAGTVIRHAIADHPHVLPGLND